MTVHLPSRRVLVVCVLLVLAGLVAFYWQLVLAVIVAGVWGRILWIYHRSRRVGARASKSGGGLPRWLEAFALLSGARSAHQLTAGRSEQRRDELHAARLETEAARAAELRSRVEQRKRTRDEQEAAEKRAYIRGAADAEGFER